MVEHEKITGENPPPNPTGEGICTNCRGSGWTGEEICSECSGTGEGAGASPTTESEDAPRTSPYEPFQVNLGDAKRGTWSKEG